MKKRIFLGLVAAVFTMALGTAFAAPVADTVPVKDATAGGIAPAGAADNAACRQWCSERVCNSKDQCWIRYWCCG